MSTVHGLDVSHHQGAVDWQKVARAGYRFAFCKATEGHGYSDPTHARNVMAARAAGLVVGSYHFARPTGSASDPNGRRDALEQARWFAGHLGSMGGGRLPAVLDLETAGNLTAAQLREWARTFLTELDRLTGRRSVLYTGTAFYRAQGLYALTQWPLWVARYTSAASPGVRGWTFWQHASDGQVPGVVGRCDVNVYAGSPAQLNHLAQLDPIQHHPAPKPAPHPAPAVRPPAPPSAPPRPVTPPAPVEAPQAAPAPVPAPVEVPEPPAGVIPGATTVPAGADTCRLGWFTRLLALLHLTRWRA